MKAFPECWVSTFFITLYSLWFSFNTNGLVSTGLRFQNTDYSSEIRIQRWSINWTYRAHFLIEDVSQVGDVLEHRNIATNPTVGTNPALSLVNTNPHSIKWTYFTKTDQAVWPAVSKTLFSRSSESILTKSASNLIVCYPFISSHS